MGELGITCAAHLGRLVSQYAEFLFPNLEGQGLSFVLPLPLDQSGVVEPTRDQRLFEPAKPFGSWDHKDLKFNHHRKAQGGRQD